MSLGCLNHYCRLILTERSWSWTVVGIAYILTGLLIRGFFIGPVERLAKKASRPMYDEIKSAYLIRAVWGWIFFLIPLVIFCGLWYRGAILPLSVQDAPVILIGIIGFTLSILFHLRAFAAAAILVLAKALDKANGRDL